MTPSTADIFDVLEHTWPAAQTSEIDGWLIRDGQRGGNRVSSATRLPGTTGDIKAAETAMSALKQPHQFMIREGDQDLDAELEQRGYVSRDPTIIYVAPIETLTQKPIPKISAFPIWPPLAILRDIWAEAGIGPNRLAVMERAVEPKTCILGRAENRAAAAAFVSIRRNFAMLHALEVVPNLRRKGVGRNMLRASAHWAQENNARFFSLAVTTANLAANALYCDMGLTVVAKYHYRVKKKQETNRGST